MGTMKEDMMHELVIKKSGEFFLKHGYNGTTMDMIAETCQISKPTLYKYFPGKYELFMHLSLHVEMDIYNFLIDLMAKGEDKVKVFEQIIDYLYQVVEEKGDFFRMMMREHHLIVHQNVEQHIEWYIKSRDELISGIADFLRDWIHPEIKKAIGLEAVAATIYNMMSGLVTDILFQRPIECNAYKRFFIHFLKKGLIKEV